MKSSRAAILPITLLFLLSDMQPAHAGAWSQRKHGYFFKSSVNYLFTESEFNHEGTELPISFERPRRGGASFRDINVTSYLEYGFTDRLTGIANLSMKILTAEWVDTVSADLQLLNSFTEGGPADLTLGLRYPLIQQPLVLSLQGGVKLPLFYDGPEEPDKESPPLGSGEVDAEGQILLGRSLYPLPLYLTAGAGYRVRGGVFNDEYFYQAELGFQQDRWLIKVVVDGIVNTEEPQDLAGAPRVAPEPGGGGDFAKIIGDQNIAKISPGIFYYLHSGLAVSAEVLHVFHGKNTVTGTIFSVGVIFNN